jgi:hypothetical protein
MKAFKVLGVAAKGTGKIIVRLLPVKQALRASVLIAARRTLWRGAGKCIAGQVPYRARRQIKFILASSFGLVALKSDVRSPYEKREKPANIVMPSKEVLKAIMGKY